MPKGKRKVTRKHDAGAPVPTTEELAGTVPALIARIHSAGSFTTKELVEAMRSLGRIFCYLADPKG